MLAISSVMMVSNNAVRADALDQIAAPVSNPVNFEDPRIESNVRPLFVYHKLDEKFITQGGDVRIYALQARFAVDDRLAIIATKDGIVDLNPDTALNDESGLANVALGAKYALHKDSNSIVTAGLRYEAPLGAERVLQGTGDGSINPFVSGAVALGCDEHPINLVAGTGFRFAFDDKDSSFYDADFHVDTKFGWLSPLFEVNVVHVLSAGDRLPIRDEGQDFFNFGAKDSEGETMVTGAAGARVQLADSVSWGTAYQFPLLDGPGTRVTDWRITTDLVVKF